MKCKAIACETAASLRGYFCCGSKAGSDAWLPPAGGVGLRGH